MKSVLMVAMLLVTFACPPSQPLEQTARDVSASLSGLLSTAQAQHQECVADSSPVLCQTIKRGVAGQNALITALEGYCGWSTGAPPPDPTVACVPVNNAQDGLKSAIANAQELTNEVKGTVK